MICGFQLRIHPIRNAATNSIDVYSILVAERSNFVVVCTIPVVVYSSLIVEAHLYLQMLRTRDKF